MTALAAFLSMMVLAEYDPQTRRVWLIRVATAVAIVVAFWWLMSDLLLLRMPAGLLI